LGLLVILDHGKCGCQLEAVYMGTKITARVEVMRFAEG
jgi:hypothetical protein